MEVVSQNPRVIGVVKRVKGMADNARYTAQHELQRLLEEVTIEMIEDIRRDPVYYRHTALMEKVGLIKRVRQTGDTSKDYTVTDLGQECARPLEIII